MNQVQLPVNLTEHSLIQSIGLLIMKITSRFLYAYPAFNCKYLNRVNHVLLKFLDINCIFLGV